MHGPGDSRDEWAAIFGDAVDRFINATVGLRFVAAGANVYATRELRMSTSTDRIENKILLRAPRARYGRRLPTPSSSAVGSAFSSTVLRRGNHPDRKDRSNDCRSGSPPHAKSHTRVRSSSSWLTRVEPLRLFSSMASIRRRSCSRLFEEPPLSSCSSSMTSPAAHANGDRVRVRQDSLERRAKAFGRQRAGLERADEAHREIPALHSED